MIESYDPSWDLEESVEGNVSRDAKKFDKKCTEWEKRSWESWLRSHLKFPFPVWRMEDYHYRGKQKRVKSPPMIGRLDVDEFIYSNADPIWLHQHEMWEYIIAEGDVHETDDKDRDIPF